jgi:3-oxoacyl-[acyl-carrier-protein] synthase-3
MPLPAAENRWRRLVEECFRREAGSQAPIPDYSADLIETGILDSMGWVSFLRSLETAGPLSDLGSLLTEQPPTLFSVFHVLENAQPASASSATESFHQEVSAGGSPAVIATSTVILGSRTIPSEEVDRAFGMDIGKLRGRAGIESLAYATEGESELTLGAKAAQEALCAAGGGPQDLDWIIATSETHRGYPSLAAQLHSHLLVRETCGALDIGGACLGLLNAFAVAQGFVASGQARAILVVTADVHSRLLTPNRVPGEFGGLFGDGASAFLLRSGAGESPSAIYRLGEFFFGCAGQYAGAIRVAEAGHGSLDVHFDGEALSRAAITRLEKVLSAMELRSGISRSSVEGFATHQPNPRLVALLVKQLGVSPEKFPPIARDAGNLGSSTCGAALHAILQSALAQPSSRHQPIFLASLGPGLLFGGGWLIPQAVPPST